ncbi:MAG: hypothetical protein EOO85_22220 [Pedobacter sp.]|nr:MAG: hypothetical protein EOO85_22220 [Pedobacter sp.]
MDLKYALKKLSLNSILLRKGFLPYGGQYSLGIKMCPARDNKSKWLGVDKFKTPTTLCAIGQTTPLKDRKA